MHVLYDQNDFEGHVLIVSILTKKLYVVDYVWCNSFNITIISTYTDTLIELTTEEYSGKFRHAYKNEGLVDE